MFQICFGLYLGGEILAQRPHVGGWYFSYRVYSNLYDVLVLTSTRNNIFTKRKAVL